MSIRKFSAYHVDKRFDHLLAPGFAELIVYKQGFKLFKSRMRIQDGKFSRLNLKLNAAGVPVSSKGETVEQFKASFLGASLNTARCKIINPQAALISAEKMILKDPLVIENAALGYRLTYYLDEPVEFVNAIRKGVIRFDTLVPKGKEQLVAARLGKRFGLVNTMVFTHIPSSLCLIVAAFAPNLWVVLTLLLVRAALSQMDVPTRTSYVMAVVTPAERPAAASFTAVPRSLASAISPSITGAMFAAGAMIAPLVACGVLKIAYDLALFAAFRRVERRSELAA